MVKEALELRATAPVRAPPLQKSSAEALVGALVAALHEVDQEALVEPREEVLLEAPEQALGDPPAEAPVQQQHGRLQAQVVQSLRAQIGSLMEGTPHKRRPLAELAEEVGQVLPLLEGHRKLKVVVPVGHPEVALLQAALPVGALVVQNISAKAPALGVP